jgi:hypothetical protein
MSTIDVNDVSPPANPSTDQSSPAPAVAAPPKNKPQLHQRVHGRLSALEAVRTQLAGQEGSKGRVKAIETAIDMARNSMSGGWENVGQVQAAQLSQWLSDTGGLISI